MAGNVRAIFLTEEDQELLRTLLDGAKNRVQNPRLPTLPVPPRNGRGMFIALPQTQIPPLEEFGSADIGTSGSSQESGDADIPGSALCELFRLVDDGLYSLGGRLERVYNISRNTIEIDWIQVHQDKFGVWWAITPGSSPSCNDVYFVITDDGTVTGTGTGSGTIIGSILERPCGCDTVPEEDEGSIELTSMPCLEIVVGLKGWAKYVVNSEPEETGTGTGTGGSGCHWRIYSLCCDTDT